MYFVYILRTSQNTLYTGVANSIERRVYEHNHVKSKAAKYTWARKPVKLVYSEKYSTIGEAMRREREIKRMTRDGKLKLIVNPTLPSESEGMPSPIRGGKIVEVNPSVKHEDDIILRSYNRCDYSGVMTVLKEAQLFDETWDSPMNLEGMIIKEKSAILVAIADTTVVGVVYLVPFGPQFIQLFRLAVKKDYRNCGIATKLIDRAQEIAKKRGVLEVGLFVESKNIDLRSFYRKRGFGGSDKEYVFMWKAIDKNNS